MSSPGPIAKLQRSFAYRVSRLFPSEFLRWIDLVSAAIDNPTPPPPTPVAPANTRFVAIDGNDGTGDGSLTAPYLTIAAAMASITLASITNPWIVDVGPGVFATVFTVKNGVTVRGAGGGPGQFNATSEAAATIVAPHTTQVLDASFAGAGSKWGGITNCAFSNDFQADFASIGSTGDARFFLQSITTSDDINFVGAGAAGSSAATVENLYIFNFSNLRFTNMLSSAVAACVGDFGGGAQYIQSAAINGFHTMAGSFWGGGLTLTWTSAAIANLMIVQCDSRSSPADPIVSGVGAALMAPASISLTMPDAAARLSFGNNASGTLIGVNGGLNVVQGTPTASRTLTIDRPHTYAQDTRIVVRNLASAFIINLTFASGSVAGGSPTFVPPGGEVDIIFDFTSNRWLATLSTSSSSPQDQVRYVRKDGNDSNNGSFNAPFLTIQAAITSITDATVSKPYTVEVGAGDYTTAFLLEPNIYVNGCGAGGRGATRNGVTIIKPTAAQALSTNFQGAAVNATGISNCVLSAALAVDFRVGTGSTGQGTIELDNIATKSTITIIGNNVLNAAELKNVNANGVDINIYNMGTSDLSGSIMCHSLNYSQDFASPSEHYAAGVCCTQRLSLQWTSAAVGNSLSVFVTGSLSRGTAALPSVEVIGVGAVLYAPDQTLDINLADSDRRIGFGTASSASVMGLSGGTNLIVQTPTATRTLTIDPPASYGKTVLLIRNLSSTINMLLTYSAGPTVEAFGIAYVLPGMHVRLTYDGETQTWIADFPKTIDLKIPISSANTNNQTLYTFPTGCRALMMFKPFWEVTANWTGGAASAIGLDSSATRANTAGDVLGGPTGDVAAGLLAADVFTGTTGSNFDGNASHDPMVFVAADTIRFNRITSAFTAGTGFAHVPIQLIL